MALPKIYVAQTRAAVGNSAMPRAASFLVVPPQIASIVPGLRGHYILQRRDGASVVNLAGGADMTVIGAPAYLDPGPGVTTSKADCFSTGFDLTSEASYFGIARKFTAGSAVKKALIGNYAPTAPCGDMVAADENGLSFFASRVPPATTDGISMALPVTLGDWYFWAATVTATQQSLYLGYKGTLTAAPPEAQASRPSTGPGRPLKVGGNDHPSSYASPGVECYAGIASQALGAAQVANLYATLRLWLASNYGAEC